MKNIKPAENSAEKNLIELDKKIAMKMKNEIEFQKLHILTREELQHFEKRKKHIVKILEKII